jgi:Integrase zinc binding domain/RNase H-like domain found in reverse transcriptase
LEGLQRKERFDILTDHKALEYFMTTKKLNARQARWAEFLSQFYFLIRYRPGKQNILADVLTRKHETKGSKDKDGHRLQVLLKPDCLEAGVAPEETDYRSTEILMLIEPTMTIVERVIAENQTASLLEEYRAKARKGHRGWQLENDRLLFRGRLVVPDEGDLRARLLDEIHRQTSTAHPGQRKTKRLLQNRYYWPTWNMDVDR